ncbi:sulfite oxidase subunit YedZ [Aestuariivirga litoralis]|uniref:Sulfite oxidase subunit YedZ n=1 Tax=Aestuariivirga litoralis TaxID=2650924 RepID=A0A2W2BGR1_9HYPH|nr:ferric reductase-like transmembrane domain-containing protein [Aestuariivirga litoralis]PZF75107.1 sulfite oxidase subunit YedZ [Aestuariivirga litoralis]
MLRRLVDSHWAFRLFLALPALGMLAQFLRLHSWGLLIGQSGEWAVRMLILTLAVSPIRILMKQLHMGPHWPAWLLKRRRDLGMACFLYAALHLAAYLVRQWNIHVVLYDLRSVEYAAGWLGFVTLLALAVTSNDASVHWLGTWWKPLQRTVYLSAIAVFLHWYWIRQDHDGLWLHLVPLAVLEGYRLLHNFARPAGLKH